MVQVTTTFIGASATDVEASVATPLEQQINGVEKGIYMKSTNANDGTLTLKVSFEVGSDQDMDNVLTQNRVSQAHAADAAVGQELRRHGEEGAGVSAAGHLDQVAERAPTTAASCRTTRPSTSTTRSRASRASGRSTCSAAATTPCASGCGPIVIGRLGLTVPDIVERHHPAEPADARPARSAVRRRRPAPSTPTPSARRAACSTKRSSATSSCAPTRTARRCG